MAAQGGIRDKILRVSMPFEKGRREAGSPAAVRAQKHPVQGNAMDPWLVVLKLRLWAAQLREGKVRSCAEIAIREGLTPARVSLVWPLARVTRKRMDDVLKASQNGRISLRRLLRIVRQTDANGLSYGTEKQQEGN